MGHFHKLLCEEMIFPLLKGKNDGLRYEVIIFSRGFIRKSLYKIFEQINEKKFRAGINGYFCIKKIIHFNGNEYLSCWKRINIFHRETSGSMRGSCNFFAISPGPSSGRLTSSSISSAVRSSSRSSRGHSAHLDSLMP